MQDKKLSPCHLMFCKNTITRRILITRTTDSFLYSNRKLHTIRPIMSKEEEQPIVLSGVTGTDNIVDGWYHERSDFWPGQAMSLKVNKVLESYKSKFQDVLVFESATYGNVLVLDGVIQATERDEFSYQEMIAHIPLFSHPNPKKVLCIGGGDGGVLREIAKHTCVEEITICEIDEEVINVSKKYLPTMACGYNDPRVTVHVYDGAKFLQEHVNEYDVIITDSSDPVGPGIVLFETPFYQAMYNALRDGGIVCTQGENVWLHLNIIKPLVNSIKKIYTTVELAYASVPTYPSGQLGYIVATKNTNTSSCKVPTRTLTDPTLQKQMKYYSTEMHTAAFVLPAFAHRAIYEEE